LQAVLEPLDRRRHIVAREIGSELRCDAEGFPRRGAQAQRACPVGAPPAGCRR